VVVSDGRTATATVRLSGCTPTPVTPPSTNPPPSGTCVIAPQAPATYNAGDLKTYFFTTTGCDTSTGPVQWSFLSGRIPVGMTGPFFQGQTAGAVSGQPTTEGTYSFTVQVTDSAGATDTETFTITVAPPRPLTITSPTAVPGTVGHSYWITLAADGGIPNYTWALRSGTLPNGLRLTSSGSIAGTTTLAGAFSFTVAATDARGTTAVRTLSITVG
jgi:Putative Ig domain